jgi:hypothetical protein
MILIVDPITIPTADLRALPPERGAELFLRAIRTVGRDLLYSPEATWERYRSDSLPPGQLRLVVEALDAYLTQLPEFARVTLLGLAHDGRGTFARKVLMAPDESQETGMLEAFWTIAAVAARRNATLVSFGGTTFGGPFLLRRSRLVGLTPSIRIPLGRYRPDEHFDLSAILANWNRGQEFSLELWASQYGVAGPWERDTASAIRDHLLAGELAQATALAEARVEAIQALYQRLAPAYAA